MFFQGVMSEMLYFVSCLHVWENLEEIRIGSFYYGEIANVHNLILNIDHMHVSLLWINSVACGNNPKPPTFFTFGFTTCCLQNASEESYKNASHPGCCKKLIYKIQTNTGLYKSWSYHILVCLMIYKNKFIQIRFS